MATDPKPTPPYPQWQLREGTPRSCQPRKHREVRGVRPEIDKQIRACIEGQVPTPLFFTGVAGSGKTCAALCVCDSYAAYYYTVAEWCDRVEDAMFGRLYSSSGYTISRKALWDETMGEQRLYVLDELGERRTISDHHYGAIKRLLDARENLPLIVISNSNLEGVKRLYQDPIYSRLRGGTVIDFGTKDRRQEKQL